MQLANADGPLFTTAQVEWLKQQYPPRCYVGGDLEAHLMFAGKVELIAWMAARVVDGPVDAPADTLEMTEEELEALRDTAVVHQVTTEGNTIE